MAQSVFLNLGTSPRQFNYPIWQGFNRPTSIMQREQYLYTLTVIQRDLLTASIYRTDWYKTIVETLRQTVQACRVYIFEVEQDYQPRVVVSQKAESCAPDVLSQQDNVELQHLLLEDIPYLGDQYLANQMVSSLVANLPERSRAHLEKQGILSVLGIPFQLQGKFFGFIGFDNCREARLWENPEIEFLTNVAMSIALTLERLQAERALHNSHQQLESLVRKRTQALLEQTQQLQTSLAEKDILFKEVHHRVKNNLQIISSILRMQARRARASQDSIALKEATNRIQSMAILHEHLYKSSDMTKICIRRYFEHLFQQLIRSYFSHAQSIDHVIQVTDFHLTLDQGIACGLILTELIVNSIKHAFPNHDNGKIAVQFNTTDNENGQVLGSLIVEDNGIGVSFDANTLPQRQLGLEIVLTLTQQLNGKLHVGDATQFESGSSFQIDFPLS
jgi:two-component sensor histidine kinase